MKCKINHPEDKKNLQSRVAYDKFTGLFINGGMTIWQRP